MVFKLIVIDEDGIQCGYCGEFKIKLPYFEQLGWCVNVPRGIEPWIFVYRLDDQ